MAFEFDRYINGQLMAEGVTIERQDNLPDAMRAAARIASRGPNGEVPVLVLRAEALSRTGAVKVPSGEIEEIVSDLEYWSERLADMRQPQGQSSLKHAASILSALVPAAPEGSQTCATEGCDNPATNEFIRDDIGSFYCGDCFGKVIEVCEARRSPEGQHPVAEAVHWKGAYDRMSARNATMADALILAVGTLDDLASGVGLSRPIEQIIRELNDVASSGGCVLTRPSEQAVTEAQPDPIELVREKIESLSKGKDAAEYVIATMVTNLKAGNVTTSQLLEWFESEGRAALKAAMEAGG